MNKKLLSIVLTVVLSAILFAVGTFGASAAVGNGTCGESLTWSLDDTGTLTIAGTGEMTNYSYSNRAPWYANRVSIETVVIGDGVTSVGDSAFYWCSSLTSVTIPDSVTSVGSSAFSSCSSLTSITIPNSVTSIGYHAFSDTPWLNNYPSDFVVVGNGILIKYKGTGDNAIIPGNVKTMGYYAFYGCTGLTSITIPDSVTSIDDGVFSGCTGLISVTIGKNVTSIGEGAFSGCTALKTINYNAKNVTSFDMLWINSVYVENIVFGDNVEVIPESLLYNYKSLTSVTIGKNVTTIGNEAFLGCTHLKTINYNAKNITSIGSNWIDYYNYDATIETIVFGNSVEVIPERLLYGCNKLTTVTFEENSRPETIGNRAFSGCTSLASITIPDSVTSIGWEAFNGCAGLTSITIPDSVTLIESSAFKNCVNLTGVTFKAGIKLELIGDYAFLNCTSLTRIEIPAVPTDIGKPEIGIGAFKNCSELEEIIIPVGVLAISDEMFSGCSELEIIRLPGTVITIGSSAFYNCDDLYSIEMPYVETIKEKAFQNCNVLSEVTISDSLTSIGKDAFSGCARKITIYGPIKISQTQNSAGYEYAKLNNILFEENRTFTVTFESQSGGVLYRTNNIDYYDTITALTEPGSNYGYTFAGWEDQYGKLHDGANIGPIEYDLVLTPKYSKNIYTLEFQWSWKNQKINTFYVSHGEKLEKSKLLYREELIEYEENAFFKFFFIPTGRWLDENNNVVDFENKIITSSETFHAEYKNWFSYLWYLMTEK